MSRPPTTDTRTYTRFPYTTLFRSEAASGQVAANRVVAAVRQADVVRGGTRTVGVTGEHDLRTRATTVVGADRVVERRSRFRRDVRLIPVEIHDVRPRCAFQDRKSTRLNSSH